MRIAAPPQAEDIRGVVYYLRFCCRIRIGTTTDLEGWLRAIPHDEVMATEPGGYATEARRHRQFAGSRVAESEWFEASPALTAHIKALQANVGGNVKQRLIPTDEAVLYTGRDRQTLYRWRREGRITGHGSSHRPLWDVWELPVHSPGTAFSPPPPILKISRKPVDNG